MTIKKMLIAGALFLISSSTAFGYEEVSCDSNPIFASNSCSQCFDGGNKQVGNNLGFLSDEWVNTSSNSQLIYKEEQDMPRMINLGGEKSSWKQIPSTDNFWEYTKELESLYSDVEDGYILSAGQKVKWLQSALGYAYNLETNTAPQGSDIGLLVYNIAFHDILNGEISVSEKNHSECVLYKSGVENVVEEVFATSSLPPTGPEKYLFLLFIGLIFGFGITIFRKKI